MAKHDFDFWEALNGREAFTYSGQLCFIASDVEPNGSMVTIIDFYGRETEVDRNDLESASPEELEGFGA